MTAPRPVVSLLPDAGRRIGMGHVGRCVALAQALAAEGYDARIVTRDPDAARFARALGVATARTMSESAIAVLDAYVNPRKRIAALRRIAGRVVAIDDLHQLAPRETDLVLRPSIGERSARALRGGARYVLLRREYWRARPRTLAREVRTVLVTLGARPRRGLLREATQVLLRALPHARLIVIGGGASAVEPARRIHAVECVPSLLNLLRRADLAFTAGGQTLYEALASGTPTMALGTAENQRRNLGAAQRAGVALVIGWTNDERWRDRLAAHAARLAASVEDRRRLSRRARALVDGKGARRAAGIIREL